MIKIYVGMIITFFSNNSGKNSVSFSVFEFFEATMSHRYQPLFRTMVRTPCYPDERKWITDIVMVAQWWYYPGITQHCQLRVFVVQWLVHITKNLRPRVRIPAWAVSAHPIYLFILPFRLVHNKWVAYLANFGKVNCCSRAIGTEMIAVTTSS